MQDIYTKQTCPKSLIFTYFQMLHGHPLFWETEWSELCISLQVKLKARGFAFSSGIKSHMSLFFNDHKALCNKLNLSWFSSAAVKHLF